MACTPSPSTPQFMSSSLIAMAQFPDTRYSATESLNLSKIFFNQVELLFLEVLFWVG